MDEYSLPVHKSLMEPDQLLGIDKTMFMLIVVVTILLMYIISPWAFVVAPVLWFPVRLVTKSDPQLFAILMESLFDPDFLEG